MSSSNMKNLKILGLIVLVTAIAGAYLYPKYVSNQVQVIAGAVGDTQSTPKMAQVQASGNGTYIASTNRYQYASFCNAGATDWVLETIEEEFDGLTTVSTSTTALTLFGATTTSATAGIGTNYGLFMTQATSSPLVTNTGTTTPGIVEAGFKRIIGAGTCFNIEGNATTSASVYIKMSYLQE